MEVGTWILEAWPGYETVELENLWASWDMKPQDPLYVYIGVLVAQVIFESFLTVLLGVACSNHSYSVWTETVQNS